MTPDVEHPPARAYRLAQQVIDSVQSTPELEAVVQLLKPVLDARKWQDKANAAQAKADKLSARYKPTE